MTILTLLSLIPSVFYLVFIGFYSMNRFDSVLFEIPQSHVFQSRPFYSPSRPAFRTRPCEPSIPQGRDVDVTEVKQAVSMKYRVTDRAGPFGMFCAHQHNHKF